MVFPVSDPGTMGKKVTFPKIAGMSKPRFYLLTFPKPITRSPFTGGAAASCLALGG